MFAKTKLAISIEGHTIRLLTCKGRKVRWWTEVALDSRLLRNGFLVDARGFGQALGASAEAAKAPKGHVVAALSGFQSIYRITSVPKNAGRDIASLVTSEARRALPDIERNMFLFWKTFGPKDAPLQSVFLLGVPRQPLITFFEALSVAGKRPKTMDLRPLALARSVNRQDAIIGNSENAALDVIIVRNDVPALVRSLYLGEDFESAEYLNARLAEELARTVAHFNNTGRDGALAPDTPVYITGSGASDPSLISMVQDMTQHPVDPLEPPFDYPADFPVDRFMVHLGLMLK